MKMSSPPSWSVYLAVGMLAAVEPGTHSDRREWGRKFAAVPILLSLLDDPRPSVRQCVTQFLPEIDAARAAEAQAPSD